MQINYLPLTQITTLYVEGKMAETKFGHFINFFPFTEITPNFYIP